MQMSNQFEADSAYARYLLFDSALALEGKASWFLPGRLISTSSIRSALSTYIETASKVLNGLKEQNLTHEKSARLLLDLRIVYEGNESVLGMIKEGAAKGAAKDFGANVLQVNMIRAMDAFMRFRLKPIIPRLEALSDEIDDWIETLSFSLHPQVRHEIESALQEAR